MTMAALPTAQLIIYCILSLPILYCLYSHGKSGLLGWLYLFVFCTLRIIGSGLELRQGDLDSSSSSALLVNNIGLSPLLLAAMGILHEAYVIQGLKHYCTLAKDTNRRAARNLISNAKLEWAFVLIYHVAVSASLAIIACAISALTNKDSKMSATTSLDLVKVGFVIMLVCWLALVAWTSISLRSPRDCDLISRRYVDGIKVNISPSCIVWLVITDHLDSVVNVRRRHIVAPDHASRYIWSHLNHEAFIEVFRFVSCKRLFERCSAVAPCGYICPCGYPDTPY